MTSPITKAPETPVKWTVYQRQGQIEARPWTADDAHAYANRTFDPFTISVSLADHSRALDNISVSGYVARNPANHADQWYIAPDYFAKHYSAVQSSYDSLARELEQMRATKVLISRERTERLIAILEQFNYSDDAEYLRAALKPSNEVGTL